MSIIRDKDNQEWCAFPDQTPQQDGILDEHKQLAKEGKEKNEWILCSDFKIDKTDSKTIEQYDLKSLSGTAWLK